MSEQRGHHRVVMVGPVMALSVFGVLQLWAAIRKERGQIKHLFMNVFHMESRKMRARLSLGIEVLVYTNLGTRKFLIKIS